MNIIVLVKQVPDTETIIKIRDDKLGIVTDNVKYVVNPYDEYAIEEAIRIKEKLGGEITVISLGPSKAIEAIRSALAMGADKAIHINDLALEDSDSITVAKAIAKALKGIPFDIILCGKQAVDDDSCTVGPALAEFLDIPHINVVSKVEISPDKSKVTVSREIEGGAKEIVESTFPVLITATKGLNEPRYASLPNILKAKKKEVKNITLKDLGLTAGEVGKEGSKTIIKEMFSLPPRKAGIKIAGEEPKDMAFKLVKLLREEAKVI